MPETRVLGCDPGHRLCSGPVLAGRI